MGHERVGTLPKSKRWRTIVGGMAAFSTSHNNIPTIAEQTLRNVQGRFQDIKNDTGVQAAFQFLALLSIASKQKSPSDYFASHGIEVSENITPLQIAKAVNIWVSKQSDSNEYASFARSAAIDAISEWYKKNQTFQINLFAGDNNQKDVWRKAADGSGFCELSRLFFSKFTEKYLCYFLERSASSSMNNIETRNHFSVELRNHIDDISEHAFQTAKITQSFAAGWFNKNVKDTIPSLRKTQGFLNIAFGKMRGELLREEDTR